MPQLDNNTQNKFLQTANTTAPLLFSALATPFKHGKLHLPSLEVLLSKQMCKQVDGVVALGTTAESGQLTDEEKAQILSTVNLLYNRPIVVGVSAQNEFCLLSQAEFALRHGASALLVSPPAFCKCTSDGYIKLLLKLKRQFDVPTILYNVPSRVGYSLDHSIVNALAEKGVNFVKECATDGNLIACADGRYRCFSGNDEALTKHMSQGASGTISVVSNVYPILTKQILTDTSKDAYSAHAVSRFNAVAKLCSLQTNPVAVKYLLYKTGIFATPEMRLPLTSANKRTRRLVDEFLQREPNKR